MSIRAPTALHWILQHQTTNQTHRPNDLVHHEILKAAPSCPGKCRNKHSNELPPPMDPGTAASSSCCRPSPAHVPWTFSTTTLRCRHLPETTVRLRQSKRRQQRPHIRSRPTLPTLALSTANAPPCPTDPEQLCPTATAGS